MSKVTVVPLASVILALAFFAGCGGSAAPDPPSPPVPAPLSAANTNLIFVVSEDLTYHAPGDVNPRTANLTNQGLQRSLRMATFLQQDVLGNKNVSADLCRGYPRPILRPPANILTWWGWRRLSSSRC